MPKEYPKQLKSKTQETFLTEYVHGVLYIKQIDNMMFYKESE